MCSEMSAVISGNTKTNCISTVSRKIPCTIRKTKMYTDGKNLNIKAGADFFLDNRNTLGVLATTNFNDNTWYSKGSTFIYDNKTGIFIKRLDAFNTIPEAGTMPTST